ncbi:hypothetical protein AHAS_Ahas07G0085400 [Arachis hypogaea]
MFYEFDLLFIYEDPMFGSYYVLGAEPHVRLYILCDIHFTHPIDSSYFNPNHPCVFPLSWLHSDSHGHPFPDSPIHAQHVHEAAPELDVSEGYLPNPPLDVVLPPIPLAPPSPSEQLQAHFSP